MPSPTLRPLIDLFHAPARPRVLSLVVTIFGDAALPRGGRIAMADLSTIMGAVGVSDGALRTAMSRLAAEGWVEREKEGRLSFYSLSGNARRDSEAAARLIYAADPIDRRDWVLSIDQNAIDAGGAALTRSVRILPSGEAEREARAGRFVISGSVRHMPDWVTAAVASPEFHAEFRALEQALRASGLSDGADGLSATEALTGRILIAHHWRRLILRHAFLPEGFVPDDWPGLSCFLAVVEAYRAVAEPAEAFWSAPDGSARETILCRFRQEAATGAG